MTNSVDHDETAHYELSYLDLHCLQRYMYWSAGMKGFNSFGAKFQTTFVVCVFNNLSFGKTVICKVERLNAKQRISR